MTHAWRVFLVISSRGLIGLLRGQSEILFRMMVFQITPSSELVSLGMCRTFAQAAGTGLGPLLPFAIWYLAPGPLLPLALLSRALLLVSCPAVTIQ